MEAYEGEHASHFLPRTISLFVVTFRDFVPWRAILVSDFLARRRGNAMLDASI
jgi:hypothetical protein